MIISDLNHLEVVNQKTQVVGGWGGNNGDLDLNIDIYKDVDVNVKEDVDIYKEFDIEAEVKGISAFAEAEAIAMGDDAHAESLTFTFTEDYFAASSAQSVSVTG
ncbi:hypothetical protein [Oscillatoria acuminata]|uniref:Uncharacterized protein n=1 Tax=Oscillatoria acuminata PCC 6304 TaxID=56110 RepID=K9TAF8_9CYAN|nr:hypothetical protein [Oscillatoria acuminata]AFY79852.1 hypothetical protein Oscil6304_0094 [Oscillatoria acuminata PCC 6304]